MNIKQKIQQQQNKQVNNILLLFLVIIFSSCRTNKSTNKTIDIYVINKTANIRGSNPNLNKRTNIIQ